MKGFGRAAIVLALTAAGPAVATEPSTRTLESVAVTGIRHPQEFDFADGLRLVRRFDALDVSQRDKTRLSFYAKAKGTPLDAGNLRLDVVAGDAEWPVEVLPNARIVLPSIPGGQADRAKVVANVPRGALAIVYKVDVVPPTAGSVTLDYLRDAAQQTRRGWKAVYGKVAAMTVPVFTCVEFEFSSPQTIVLAEAGRTLWTSPTDEKVRVPLEIPGATGDATFSWPHAALVRIGGCKLKRDA